jgi:hypothetical protein
MSNKMGNVEKEGYELPKVEATEVVVTEKKTTKDTVSFSDLPNLEKIKIAAEQNGVTILEPKKNCKYCNGLGYVSVKNFSSSKDESIEMPNPCRCIFAKEDLAKMFTGRIRLGRSERRKHESREAKEKGVHSVILKSQKEIIKKKKLKKLKKRIQKINRKK